MLKKIKIKAIMFLMAIAAIGNITVSAAVPAGMWNLHGSFTMPHQRVLATEKGKVYFLSGGSLFCHDSVEGETISFTTQNYLNDADISDIFYNRDRDYLLVAYESGNIDLIFDDDSSGDFRIVNLSDIKDSNIDQSKHINGVDFAGSRVYVATDFGLVEFDDEQLIVANAGIYGKKVHGVAVIGDYVMIFVPYDMLAVKRGGKLNSLDNFKVVNSWGDIHEMKRSGTDKIVIRRNGEPGSNNYLTVHNYDPKTGAYNGHAAYDDILQSSPLLTFADGSVGLVANGWLFKIGDSGKPEALAAIPTELKGDVLGVGKNISQVWSVNDYGLRGTDLSGEQPTATTLRFMPEALAVKNVAFIIGAGKRIYVTNMGCSNYKPYANGEGYTSGQQTSVVDLTSSSTLSATDVALRNYVGKNQVVVNYQNDLGIDRPLAPVRLAEDPDDPETYYLATANDGILKIKNQKLVGRYDCDNSPMLAKSVGTRVFDLAFDKEGNLWVAYHATDESNPVLMLPAAKTKVDPSTLKDSDWKKIKTPGFPGDKDMRIFICRKSNMIFAFDSRFAHGLVAIDTRGSWSDISDDVVNVVTQFTDQDGKTFSLGTERFVSIAEDARGRVWLGSSMGVIEITNPSSISGSSITINRLKVPRNDGTNSADYLLGSDRVFDIAVDNSNRKWLATQISGVYLVNENGNEILEHYTTENSPLLSNMVSSVYADPMSNSVFFGTSEGLFEYGGTSSTPMDDYSEVYAYPNPVKPDHQGPITIVGLMNDSLVKIADSAGNVVAQMRSEGGMAVWDGCDSSGRRVKSGVYYVFASSGNGTDGSAKGGTTKIVVVN